MVDGCGVGMDIPLMGDNSQDNSVCPHGFIGESPTPPMQGTPGEVNDQGFYVPTASDLKDGESEGHGRGSRHRGYSSSY